MPLYRIGAVQYFSCKLSGDGQHPPGQPRVDISYAWLLRRLIRHHAYMFRMCRKDGAASRIMPCSFLRCMRVGVHVISIGPCYVFSFRR
jgi:hypothetical protein